MLNIPIQLSYSYLSKYRHVIPHPLESFTPQRVRSVNSDSRVTPALESRKSEVLTGPRGMPPVSISNNSPLLQAFEISTKKLEALSSRATAGALGMYDYGDVNSNFESENRSDNVAASGTHSHARIQSVHITPKDSPAISYQTAKTQNILLKTDSISQVPTIQEMINEVETKDLEPHMNNIQIPDSKELEIEEFRRKKEEEEAEESRRREELAYEKRRLDRLRRDQELAELEKSELEELASQESEREKEKARLIGLRAREEEEVRRAQEEHRRAEEEMRKRTQMEKERQFLKDEEENSRKNQEDEQMKKLNEIENDPLMQKYMSLVKERRENEVRYRFFVI
jgi:hypothetical protein